MATEKKKQGAAQAPAVTPSETVDVSEETLLATRTRALTFLAGIGSVEGIRHALASRGYTEATHTEGWQALHEASSYRAGGGFVAAPTGETQEARRALDAWDDLNFPIASASLKHRHPDAHAALFAGDLSPGVGAESVVRVSLFLDRLDALAPKHPGALSTLAARGITPDERARLRALLRSATAYQPVDPRLEEDVRARENSLEARKAALQALRAWYEEWSVIAKQVIRRKDWLIGLGLASRKRRTKPAAAAPTPV